MSGNGGVIGPPNLPNFNVASGVWRPSAIARYLRMGTIDAGWPVCNDPNWSSVTFLCHWGGDGDWAANLGSAGPQPVFENYAKTVDTPQKFYSQTAYVNITANASSRIVTATDAGFQFGTGDFTIETFFYLPSAPAGKIIWDFRSSGTSAAPMLGVNVTGYINYLVNGSDRIVGSAGAFTNGEWVHLAVCRSGSTTKLFVNGTQHGSDWTDSTTYVGTGFTLGNGNSQGGIGNAGQNIYFAETRITKGVARYTTTFQVPYLPFAAR